MWDPHRFVAPHLVLQMPGASPVHFKLHIKPGQPSQPRNQYPKTISRAGEAPGLQVVPGSVTEVRDACGA